MSPVRSGALATVPCPLAESLPRSSFEMQRLLRLHSVPPLIKHFHYQAFPILAFINESTTNDNKRFCSIFKQSSMYLWQRLGAVAAVQSDTSGTHALVAAPANGDGGDAMVPAPSAMRTLNKSTSAKPSPEHAFAASHYQCCCMEVWGLGHLLQACIRPRVQSRRELWACLRGIALVPRRVRSRGSHHSFEFGKARRHAGAFAKEQRWVMQQPQ